MTLFLGVFGCFWVFLGVLGCDFDINLTHLASLSSTNAVSAVPCRVAYRRVVLTGVLLAMLCPNWDFRSR